MDEARSERPTPRKLADARARGQVAASPLLLVAAVLFALYASALWRAPALLAAIERLLLAALGSANAPAPRALAALAGPLRDLGWALLPLLLAPCFAALLAGGLQVGPLFASGAMRPDLARVDPRARWRALASGDRLLELGYSALAACVLLALLAWWLIAAASTIAGMPRNDAQRALSVLATLAADIVLRMGVAAVLLGTIDLALRRLRLRRSLRMSRRELAAELRESHGLPEHRARRERLQREARGALDIAVVHDARVLLIDAAGRALAIGLGGEGERAPRVVAKAQGTLALRMRAAASQAGVPVREQARLVAALFRLEPGELVAAEHYAALAESWLEAGAA